MHAPARTLALITVLIAAYGAAPAHAAAWPNGMSLNGQSLNGMGLNGITVNAVQPNGIAVNALNVNGLSVNALHANGLSVNALHMNGLHANGLPADACDARHLACAQPASEAARHDSSTPRFQGRSARPLGDVGAAAAK